MMKFGLSIILELRSWAVAVGNCDNLRFLLSLDAVRIYLAKLIDLFLFIHFLLTLLLQICSLHAF